MSSHRWPSGTIFRRRILAPDHFCPACDCTGLTVCDHRLRQLDTLRGPERLVIKLAHCPAPACPLRGHTLSPSAELLVAPARLNIDWGVFAWIGQRRLARDWRVPQISAELREAHGIVLSDDSVERHIARYQAILAAREQDPKSLDLAYRDCRRLVLSIDGLQPEKGHETLYVVREVTQKRIWFAVPLLSSAASEVARLFVLARQWAERLHKPVAAWLSDKQDAFVSGIADVFPGVPHRLCANHFLRDAAKPVLELDSHAKVRMRRKVRGLRDIERTVLLDHGEAAPCATGDEPPASPAPAPASAAASSSPASRSASPQAGEVVLGYCAAVRGILNDDQGGPLHPPGVRMADALVEVRTSLHRVIAVAKPRLELRHLERLVACIDRGLAVVAPDLAAVRGHALTLAQIWDCLVPVSGTGCERRSRFDALTRVLQHDADPLRTHMGAVMHSFAGGLFAAPDDIDLPVDNLDLERAFKHPKRHRRRIHGRAHAGSGLVQVGATLLPALDAHVRHPGVFAAGELAAWHDAKPPVCQRDALRRRAVMRRARSSKKRPLLLADLERRFLAGA